MNREQKFRYEWERVLRRLALPSSVKLVGMVCAQYGNLDGREVRPGTDLLTQDTSLSKRTVCTALMALRDLGLLVRVREGSNNGRRGLADEYRLALPDDIVDQVAEWNAAKGKPSQGLMDEKGTLLTRGGRRKSQTDTPEPVNSLHPFAPGTGEAVAPDPTGTSELIAPDQPGTSEIKCTEQVQPVHHTTPVTTPVKPPHQQSWSFQERVVTSRETPAVSEELIPVDEVAAEPIAEPVEPDRPYDRRALLAQIAAARDKVRAKAAPRINPIAEAVGHRAARMFGPPDPATA